MAQQAKHNSFPICYFLCAKFFRRRWRSPHRPRPSATNWNTCLCVMRPPAYATIVSTDLWFPPSKNFYRSFLSYDQDFISGVACRRAWARPFRPLDNYKEEPVWEVNIFAGGGPSLSPLCDPLNPGSGVNIVPVHMLIWGNGYSYLSIFIRKTRVNAVYEFKDFCSNLLDRLKQALKPVWHSFPSLIFDEFSQQEMRYQLSFPLKNKLNVEQLNRSIVFGY